MKETAEGYLGEDVSQAVITVPASTFLFLPSGAAGNAISEASDVRT